MRKVLILVVAAILLLSLSIVFLKRFFTTRTRVQLPKVPAQRLADEPPQINNAVFVPYWAVEQEGTIDVSSFDRIIYFGIAPNLGGINKLEQGYQNLGAFIDQAPTDKPKLLTVRMTNFDTNLAILQNKNSQVEIINEAVEIANEFGFSGIVLDFELSSLFDDTIPVKINQFVADFYAGAKQNDLGFVVTIYGDVFYRKRPFEVATLAQSADEIMIMAYDFHKAIGEPGPNFPYEGKDKYGYDFKSMIEDFTTLVPKEKLTVIFGMYGYDWAVDEKRRPLKQAEALGLNDIRQKYVRKCDQTNCVIIRDKESQETEIDFVVAPARIEDLAENHIIWFEDEESVKKKQEYLEEQGIGSFAYWAYGYF